MKKILVFLALALVLGLAFYPIEGKSQMGPGMMGGGQYCPYCGRYVGPGGGYGMGPGMMGGGMGPGMMGPGMMGRGMMCPWYGPQYGPQYQQQPQKLLEESDAKSILENYLASTRNPNLKLGEIKDLGHAFEAKILTKEDSLADKIIVDKGTGWMRSIY